MILAVAAGGALGSAARYGLQLAWPTPAAGFPWTTLITNLTGAALLGGLMRVISHRIAPHPLLRPFLGTGVLGGFTTFSTYAVQTVDLVDAGHPGRALGYVLGTLIGALVAVHLGWSLAGAARPRPRGPDPC